MHMDVPNENKIAPTPTAGSIPAPMLEALSARFRPSGVFVALMRRGGEIDYHDGGAAPFFLRYVLPLLNKLGPPDQQAEDYRAITIDRLPGIVTARLPRTQRKASDQVLILAARDQDFTLGEDVLRMCGKLGLDAIWLGKQASELPGYGEPALERHARLFTEGLRDQMRLAEAQTELTNVSEQLAATYEELSLIYHVSSGMTVTRRSSDFFRQTCLETLHVIGARAMGVAVRGEGSRQTESIVCGPLVLPEAVVARLADDLFRLVQNRASAYISSDLSKDRTLAWLAEFGQQLVVVPLQRHDQLLGCLFALDKQQGDFNSTDAKLLSSIATESAIYLENSRLFEDMRGLMMGLMHSLTSAVDAKDPYTCGHSERVALLSRHLSQQVQLPDLQVEEIYMAGLLHDVGKIGVPEAVLQKTGKLTAAEFDQMKKHPEIGARILQDVRQMKHVIPGVLYHHERYDGRGYPAGLAGTEIPLMGRIICLGDCFDAMTSNRTYRRALPIEVAMAEIQRCAGTQFDPVLAEAFLRTTAEGYRELLSDHQQKSKKLLGMYENVIAA
jgi:HD-GYP domain-containing protein (c-di-GMP phosphodiesterase class II)